MSNFHIHACCMLICFLTVILPWPVQNLTNYIMILKGWGFCNKMCDKDQTLWVKELQQLRIRIMSDKLCKKFGSIYENNKLRLIANTRKELCGGFVNNVNVTIANYTLEENTET